MSKIGGFLKSKKARPLLIGGAVLIGGVILFMMLRGGSGSSGGTQTVSSGPSEAFQAAQMQSNTQLALGQMQANLQATQLATELQGFMYGKDADVTVAMLQADVAKSTIASQTAIQLSGIDAQKSIALAGEQTSQYGIAAQAAVQMAGFDTQATIAQSQYAFLDSQQKSQANVELARINQSASVAKKQSNNNLIGGIIGGALSLFSDSRTKKNVTWTGIETERLPGNLGISELNRFAYNYKAWTGINGHHSGYMAHEVAINNQAAVSRSSRYMLVDYDAV